MRWRFPWWTGAVVLLTAAVPAAARAAESPRADARALLRSGEPLERADDAWLPTPPQPPAAAQRTASTVPFGRFTSIQVNVSPGGTNIVGDAANEPSIAIDPTNHSVMVIGWRQFDNVASNFRQAGFAYTNNGGASWTKGTIEPGVFRSDPVLGAEAGGRFVYNSLSSSSAITEQIFRSSTHGVTWDAGVFAFGGDKQWMTIDPGSANYYMTWSTAGNSYAPNTFNKSIDQGNSYTAPSAMPNSPVWGTLDYDRDGTLYQVGWATDAIGDISVSRSTDAKLHTTAAPTWTIVPVDLGGFLQTGPPNPAGLLGQLWIAVDRSTGPRSGWVYVLASVVTDTDPLDVHFIRSTDGGNTWSAPVRVNDDAGNTAYQWFGTMSVSPSGRIDAVWNDTRGSADSTMSALRYTFSTDGGTTWAPSEQVTPVWNCAVGYPNQAKIGDYIHMISDDTGADLAYAATFTGGEDIWYVRIPNATAGVGAPTATALRLRAPAPNPSSGAATLSYELPAAGARVRLDVFDVTGQRVATLRDGFEPGGPHAATWDGRGPDGAAAAPGVYLCRLSAGAEVRAAKLLRIR